MSKEFEGGEIIEHREDVIIIPRQDVEFSAPPSPKTEEAKTSKRDEMIAFIHKKGFEMVANNPEQRCLLVDTGLGIGMFRSLEEIYQYVKEGYPTADIERYKSSLAANGYPEDFHKLPFALIRKWDELPEKIKQDIREQGVGIVEMRKVEESEAGERVIQPDPKFQTKPKEREGTKEEQKREDEGYIKYIYDTGFKIGRFDDGEVGIKIDSKSIIGPFPSLEAAYRYLKEERHLVDIASIKGMDNPTIH